MAEARQLEGDASQTFVRFHHGTDQTSANDLLQKGVNQLQAAAWNGSGEFWATTDHRRAQWFARSHPASPPAACFEFDLPQSVLLSILQMIPAGAIQHGLNDYEFQPVSHALLNQHITNRQLAPVS